MNHLFFDGKVFYNLLKPTGYVMHLPV